MMRYFICVVAFLSMSSTCSFGMNDPTRPPESVLSKMEKKGKAYVVSGIIFSDKRKVAVINQKSYVVGDMVDGQQLVKIEKDRVYLKKRGTTSMYPLLNTERITDEGKKKSAKNKE